MVKGGATGKGSCVRNHDVRVAFSFSQLSLLNILTTLSLPTHRPRCDRVASALRPRIISSCCRRLIAE